MIDPSQLKDYVGRYVVVQTNERNDSLYYAGMIEKVKSLNVETASIELFPARVYENVRNAMHRISEKLDFASEHQHSFQNECEKTESRIFVSLDSVVSIMFPKEESKKKS